MPTVSSFFSREIASEKGWGGGHSAGPEASEKEKHITQEETQGCSAGQLPALGAEPWATSGGQDSSELCTDFEETCHSFGL